MILIVRKVGTLTSSTFTQLLSTIHQRPVLIPIVEDPYNDPQRGNSTAKNHSLCAIGLQLIYALENVLFECPRKEKRWERHPEWYHGSELLRFALSDYVSLSKSTIVSIGPC